MAFNRILLAAVISAATATAFANEPPLEGGQAGVHSHAAEPSTSAKTRAQVQAEARSSLLSGGFGIWEGGEAGSQMLTGQASTGAAGSAQASRAAAARENQFPASTAAFEGGTAAGPVHQHTYTPAADGRVVHSR